MEKVSYTMEVPKETKEIVDSATSIVEHFMQGKGLDTAALLLPGIMSAVDNFKAVGEELKSDLMDEAAGYAAHKVLSALRSGSSSE